MTDEEKLQELRRMEAELQEKLDAEKSRLERELRRLRWKIRASYAGMALLALFFIWKRDTIGLWSMVVGAICGRIHLHYIRKRRP